MGRAVNELGVLLLFVRIARGENVVSGGRIRMRGTC